MQSVEEMITRVSQENEKIFKIEQTKFEALDEVACSVLKNESPDYLLPLRWNAEEKTIEYQLGVEWECMKNYKNSLKINQVIRLYDQIIKAWKDCEDYFLCPEGLYMDTNYVYIDEQGFRMQFMYIPELHQEVNWQKVRELMLSILDKCEETSGEHYQVQLYKALYKSEFKFEAIKEIVAEIKRKMAAEAWHGIDEESYPFNEKMPSEHVIKVEEESEFKEEKEQESERITPAKRLQKEIEQLVHTVYHNDKENETVEVKPLRTPEQMVIDSMARKAPVLKCVNNETRYNLPKQIEIPQDTNSFLIGRATKNGEGEKADFEFGIAVTPISRLHAQITKRDDRYYIQDLGSSNGTYLNGMRLDSKADYLLNDGDRVAFAIAYSKNSIEYVFEKE